MGNTEDVVTWSRRGLLRRVADELGDLAGARTQLRVVEAEMVMVLGEPGLSRLGDIPGLRLTVWRAVWPMLQFNPVMAAKYAAITRAADADAAGTGSQQARTAATAARAARQGPRDTAKS